MHPDTVAVQAGRGAPTGGAPLNVPPVLASVFRAGGDGPEYAREGNPTWAAFEEAVGALEGGHATAFASGIAAIAAVAELVPLGGRIVAPADAYAGGRKLLAELAALGRAQVTFEDMTDLDALAAAAAGADLVWLESPTNPLLQVVDLQRAVAIGREQGAIVAVDNTFATPLGQRPLDLGADVVVHSATKLIGGHSDLLLGVAVAHPPELHHRLVEQRTRRGAVPSPFDAFLALRGLRTLALRLERGAANAGELARRLLSHPAVERVRYPGLEEHPGHELARRQMLSFGTIVSFEVDGPVTADRVCAQVRVLVPATSLGGVETTIERRAKWSDEDLTPPGLLRVSVGCEHVDDLWDDLDHALSGSGAFEPEDVGGQDRAEQADQPAR
jgi:cystathionine gamma-synthase